MLGKTNVKVKPNKKVQYVEYIESTGTQYIDTEVIPENLTVELEYSYTESMQNAKSDVYVICGAYGENNNRYNVAAKWDTNNYAWFLGSTKTGSEIVYQTGFDTNKHKVIFNDENSNIYFDGKLITTFPELDTTSKKCTLTLFAYNTLNGILQNANHTRIYSCKLIAKTTKNVIRDFRPCKDGAGVYCLYDAVEKRYYYNQGSGSFKGEGWEPTQLEYIESTGTQYINTGFVPTANSKFELDIQYTSVPAGNLSNNSYRNGIGGATTYSRFICGYNNTGFYYGVGGKNIDKTYGDINRHVFTVDLKNMRYGYDNNLETASTTYSNPNSLPYTIFARYSLIDGTIDSYSKQKFYGCKLYDNDTLIHDFRPALDEKGVACLYDKVSKTCFYNAGTGSFLGGANV